jgi:hypothetical protein
VSLARDLGITDAAAQGQISTRYEVSPNWRGEPSVSAADAAEIIAERTARAERNAREQQERAAREEAEQLRAGRYVNQVRDLAERYAQANERHSAETLTVINRVVGKGIGDPEDRERILRLVREEFGDRTGVLGTWTAAWTRRS